jgi:hypothetical protein
MRKVITEPQARRMAARLGWALRKSRYRNPELPSFGGYMLVSLCCNSIVVGADPWAYSLTLDEAVEFMVEADADEEPYVAPDPQEIRRQESAARRMADRLGWVLVSHGGYALYDAATNTPVAGVDPRPFSLHLHEVVELMEKEGGE